MRVSYYTLHDKSIGFCGLNRRLVHHADIRFVGHDKQLELNKKYQSNDELLMPNAIRSCTVTLFNVYSINKATIAILISSVNTIIYIINVQLEQSYC